MEIRYWWNRPIIRHLLLFRSYDVDDYKMHNKRKPMYRICIERPNQITYSFADRDLFDLCFFEAL